MTSPAAPAPRPAPEFKSTHAGLHREELLQLNLEYMSWVAAGVSTHFAIPLLEVFGMPVADYVPGAIDKICADAPPIGVFYVVTLNQALAGMGGLRMLQPGVAEIKRVYVRPAFRGQRLGQAILTRLVADAQEFGFTRLCLDTGPFMQTAQSVYEGLGFSDCAAYAGTEVPKALHAQWRFMQRSL